MALEASSGERVRIIRHLLGMSQIDLAESTGFSQSHISQVENGAKLASLDFLAVVADRTSAPIQFFQVKTLDLPPGSLRFRRNVSSSRTEARRASTLLNEAYRVVSDVLSRTAVPAPVLPRESGDIDEERLEEVAQATREALSIGHDGPIMHLTRSCERAGIGVVPLSLPNASDDEYETVGHFGASCWPSIDESALIGYFSTSAGDRQRFTIAHEIGHLVLHSRRRSVYDPEGEANRFAGALLLPRHRIVEVLEDRALTLRDFAHLKATWGVSIQALIMRGAQVGYIDEVRKGSLFRQLSARGWRKKEPVTVVPEEPRLLWKALSALYGNRFTYVRAAEDLGLHAMILRGLAPEPTRESGNRRSLPKLTPTK